jgi:broad-specificity NMP kinase
MAVILVTGMSGTAKSTALNRLAQQGYRVVDTDLGGWIEDVPPPDGTGVEPQWREERIDALISEHERSGEPLFIAGSVWNLRRFYPRFDEIVLFSAPLKVMLERIANRDTNPLWENRRGSRPDRGGYGRSSRCFARRPRWKSTPASGSVQLTV